MPNRCITYASVNKRNLRREPAKEHLAGADAGGESHLDLNLDRIDRDLQKVEDSFEAAQDEASTAEEPF